MARWNQVTAMTADPAVRGRRMPDPDERSFVWGDNTKC
jgi:hypothetical protein